MVHEYTHGVANRLVGGGQSSLPLSSPQSRGMGEGWADFIACTVCDVTVIGAWVINQPEGFRLAPYTSDFPHGFGELGTGLFGGEPPHNIGSIWCATLLEMSRRIGKDLAVQLVVDAMKLSALDPGFLVMRDHILTALDDMHVAHQLAGARHAAARNGIWGAFARFGMGPAAESQGSQLMGIKADHTTPPPL